MAEASPHSESALKRRRLFGDILYYDIKLRRVMDGVSLPMSSQTSKMSSAIYPVPYLWFLLLILVTVGLYVAIEYSSNLSNIQENWPEYRCQPQFMPLAGLFGHDINENFQFCIQQIIQENTKGVAAPFATGMGGFTNILMNLMNSANSFRTMLATLVGGVIKIVSEFKARMTALMSRIKVTSGRMKAMMYRIYGTMFAVMYMGMSAQTGIANFGDSFIFKFIDTFCFPPEQPITLDSDRILPISRVKIGDILKGGHRVTTLYKFAADGQEMVQLTNVTVSSNHFVKYGGKWILAKDHPDAIVLGEWSGGTQRPLICLTTHDHLLPIGDYIFADYDETDKGDVITQGWVNNSLNGISSSIQRPSTPHPEFSYDIGAPSTTRVKLLEGYKQLRDIKLGDRVSNGKVIGIQVSMLHDVCVDKEQILAKGTLLWNPKKETWVRAFSMYPSKVYLFPIEVIALFVSPGAQYELEGGYIVRDAMEVYSPDTKAAYAEALCGSIMRKHFIINN